MSALKTSTQHGRGSIGAVSKLTLQITPMLYKNSFYVENTSRSSHFRRLPKTFFYKLEQFPFSFLCSLTILNPHPTGILGLPLGFLR